ncbi:hypothetical protein AU210_009898 [Fusarium oxysporum f. sp. radicis-cucumerinum]|uniref:Uncharacterized protein n=2 Tax=Fusarium oxysporum TaxID=5507 RepID=A0A2H3H164_FUSOX|nr:hypothetical protein AU210_009898 [Fusarium oxysporum f. sp. radicis-cucumerinum]RKK16923.1 hypothetical protein BFJ65_g10474 [Fusarium oxysporum f. sp. cepae]RKK35488.1 hypothetical protein BFJ66_g13937 [Fusarium oxysporum f. sp. cepae]RKK47069.1 hypothetical protein BFJ67_g7967 [Fusarium oxysporum f. sp. cepae]
MKIFSPVIYLTRRVWATFKLLCRAMKKLLWMMLPFYGFTTLLGLIQGPILVQWYTGTMDQFARLLVNNLYEIKMLEFFGDAYGDSFVDSFNPTYRITQIQSPLDWTSHLGLRRPRGWRTENVENMASLYNLYRRTRRYPNGEPWQHWIYLSAQMEPWKQPDGPILHDPWDQAFVKLLEYRDKHEKLGRSSFHYVSCHKSFLCGSWRVTAPALLHFTTNATARKGSKKYRDFPYHEPVSVRVFELPLREVAIPGVFPTYFEQMRALTASNSTFWTTKDTYSHFDQVRSQALPILRQLEKDYPWSYGLLVKAEEKWTSIWAMEDTALIIGAYLIPFASTAIPTYLYKLAQARWIEDKKPGTSEAELKRKDPLARGLEEFLEAMGDEDKEKFRKTARGGRLLNKIEAELAIDDWNTGEEMIQEISGALGLDKDGKVKGR